MRYFIKGLLFSILVSFCSKSFAQGINKEILSKIIKKAHETNSDALIIIHNNEVLTESDSVSRNTPQYISSAGKSLLPFAIGKLLEAGKLKSIDQPVADFYPEWKQGQKKDITIRMLLNHTSGLQNNPNASVELEPPPTWQVENVIQLALCAELSSVPGKVFEYNNKAVALLGGIIEKVAGTRMDHYFEEQFFKPMNITDVQWITDRTGHPTAHGAFIIKPRDLMKFGQLLLNKGVYNNQRLLGEQWIEQCTEVSQDKDFRFGFLWWRHLLVDKRVIPKNVYQQLKSQNKSNSVLKSIESLVGDTMTADKFNSTMSERLGVNWYEQIDVLLQGSKIDFDDFRKQIQSPEADAFYANGYRGNFLVVIPGKNIIAVRVKGNKKSFNPSTDNFSDFVTLVTQL